MRILTALTLPTRQLRRRWAAGLRNAREILSVCVAHHRNRIGLDDLRCGHGLTRRAPPSARHHLEAGHDDEPRRDRTDGMTSREATVWSARVHCVTPEHAETGAGCRTRLISQS